jgi:hypothetical protein
MSIELEPILFVNYTSITPSELADKIGLAFADFDTGEDRFQQAIGSARSEILFRLGQFDTNSYPEVTAVAPVKLAAAQSLANSAEWHRAGSILYRHKSQLELQFGESGNPLATPDGFNIGAFTPEKNVQASEYVRRANELQSEFDKIMLMIVPNTNMPFVASASGRSSFTDNGTFWGKDEWT